MKLIEHLNILVWSCAEKKKKYIYIYNYIHLSIWRYVNNSNIQRIQMTFQISWSPHIKYHLLWRRVRRFYLYFAQLDRPHLSASSQGNFHQFSLVATASLNKHTYSNSLYCAKRPKNCRFVWTKTPFPHHCFKDLPVNFGGRFFPCPKS